MELVTAYLEKTKRESFIPEGYERLSNGMVVLRVGRRPHRRDFHHTTRPIIRDSMVPPGYERSSSGIIAPVRPRTSGTRYEGQSPHESGKAFMLRRKKEFWFFWYLISALILLAVNITVGITNVVADAIIPPIGFIPLPFLIWTVIAMNRASDKHKEQEQIDKEREDTLSDEIPVPRVM
jgi:hypothetical protein